MLFVISKSTKLTPRGAVSLNSKNKTFGSSNKDDIEYVKIPKNEYDRDNALWAIFAVVETVALIVAILNMKRVPKFPKWLF